MARLSGWIAGLALALWLTYGAVAGSFLSIVWHAKSDLDHCADIQIELIGMQDNLPRNFASENTLRAQVDGSCKAAFKEAKVAESMLSK